MPPRHDGDAASFAYRGMSVTRDRVSPFEGDLRREHKSYVERLSPPLEREKPAIDSIAGFSIPSREWVVGPE